MQEKENYKLTESKKQFYSYCFKVELIICYFEAKIQNK